MAIKRREQFDYEAEMKRPMCQGCEACIYAAVPSMYARANECPHNVRRRPLNTGRKVLVGQQKQGRV